MRCVLSIVTFEVEWDIRQGRVQQDKGIEHTSCQDWDLTNLVCKQGKILAVKMQPRILQTLSSTDLTTIAPVIRWYLQKQLKRKVRDWEPGRSVPGILPAPSFSANSWQKWLQFFVKTSYSLPCHFSFSWDISSWICGSKDIEINRLLMGLIVDVRSASVIEERFLAPL